MPQNNAILTLTRKLYFKQGFQISRCFFLHSPLCKAEGLCQQTAIRKGGNTVHMGYLTRSYAAGEDDIDVDNEVEESRETLEGGSWHNVDLQLFQPGLHLQNLLTKSIKFWLHLQSTIQNHKNLQS